MEKPFWIVWNPHHPTPPQIKYLRRQDAQRAAKNMARIHSSVGAYFYVLKAQSCHQDQGGNAADFIMVGWGIGAPCPFHDARAA